jgi:ferritin-like metal-binding protein YciE
MPVKIVDLKTLLVHELKDLHHSESQLVKALPKMAKGSSNPELKQAIEHHLEETKEHVKRLESALEELDYSPTGVTCKGMQGLIEEGKEILSEDAPDDVRDAGIICAAQKVEHYEMAGYGCARTFAEQLGLQEIADLLQQTLDEEMAADEKLTTIAMNRVNASAVDG